MTMPNVTPLTPPRVADALPGPRPATGGAVAAAAALSAGAAVPPAPDATAALPNPMLRLDASLGLVVLEFRNADGTARTIPSERELAAYRSAARTAGPGAAPAAEEAPDPGAGDPADGRAPPARAAEAESAAAAPGPVGPPDRESNI